MTIKYPLSSNSWGTEELRAIMRVLVSDRFTMGPEVLAFEQEFARFHGARHSVMTNSGSSANLLAAAALSHHWRGRERGKRVIVPAIGWPTTYSPFQLLGYSLVVVEVDETLGIDLDHVRSALSSYDDIAGVVAVNVLGVPADMPTLRALCDERECWLFEDNCESLGADVGDRKAGNWGDVSTCSFFFSHHISTMEGGAVLCRSGKINELLRMMRAHGWRRDIDATEFDDLYKFHVPGFNLRPTEIAGAVGQEQMKKLPEMLRMRTRNFREFLVSVGKLPRVHTQKWRGDPSWFGFAFWLDWVDRAVIVRDLQEHGIECRPVVGGDFTQQPASQFYKYEVHGLLDRAATVHRDAIYVGNAGSDLAPQIKLLAERIKHVSA